jgi:hypothetical protein
MAARQNRKILASNSADVMIYHQWFLLAALISYMGKHVFCNAIHGLRFDLIY